MTCGKLSIAFISLTKILMHQNLGPKNNCIRILGQQYLCIRQKLSIAFISLTKNFNASESWYKTKIASESWANSIFASVAPMKFSILFNHSVSIEISSSPYNKQVKKLVLIGSLLWCYFITIQYGYYSLAICHPRIHRCHTH
jgi:hypothetical protein